MGPTYKVAIVGPRMAGKTRVFNQLCGVERIGDTYEPTGELGDWVYEGKEGYKGCKWLSGL